MGIREITHPLVKDKVGRLRQDGISTKDFRELAGEIATLLTYEATRDLPLQNQSITCWSGPVDVQSLPKPEVTIVPILRAGLGMLNGALTILPEAHVSMVGQVRNEDTLEASTYLKKLVDCLDRRLALIVDPMLATGGSLISTIDLLKDSGATQIKALVLVAAPEGINAVSAKHPDVEIYTAAIDERLNDKGYILPGLGDAGDKIFGTPSGN